VHHRPTPQVGTPILEAFGPLVSAKSGSRGGWNVCRKADIRDTRRETGSPFGSVTVARVDKQFDTKHSRHNNLYKLLRGMRNYRARCAMSRRSDRLNRSTDAWRR